MVIHVIDKDICDYCKKDIALLAEKTELRSVAVHAKDKDGNSVIYDWNKGIKSIKLRKE